MVRARHASHPARPSDKAPPPPDKRPFTVPFVEAEIHHEGHWRCKCTCLRTFSCCLLCGNVRPLCSSAHSLSQLHQYSVVGRRIPSAKNPNPPLFRMTIFAPSEIVAKSRFWYFLGKLKKLKKANGEVLSVSEVFDKKPGTIKNFGIWYVGACVAGDRGESQSFLSVGLSRFPFSLGSVTTRALVRTMPTRSTVS